MQKAILILFLSLAVNFTSFAQENNLNGTTIHYKYSNGSEVEANFLDNFYHFHWTSGPYKGIKGSAPYELIELSKKKYAINFFVEEHNSYVTLFFDFRKNKVVGSAIINNAGNVIQSIEEAEISYEEFR